MSIDPLPTEPIKLSGEIDHHRYLQLILGAIPVGVVVVDKNFIIQAVNKAAEALIGIDGTQVLGRPYDEIMQSQDGDINDPLKEAFETGQPFVNQRFYVRPGSDNSFPIRHSAAVLRDETGEIISGVTIFADISVQTQLQNQVDGQRRYLQDVLRSIPDGVVITNADLIIESWNEAAVKITGRPASEAIGNACLEILGPTLATALRSILENGTQVLLDEEAVLPLVNGQSLPVSFSADTISASMISRFGAASSPFEMSANACNGPKSWPNSGAICGKSSIWPPTASLPWIGIWSSKPLTKPPKR